MSNLLKSKFLLGVLVAVAMFAFVGTVAPTQAAADCTITSTLRVGSVGVEVQCLQGIVGATADGKFGPMTKAAVMAWQAGHGLTADGVVGPITRAALMGAPTGNFPAGCTSASGYSATTGMPCNTGTSSGLPAGCTSTSGYSPLTGAKCSGGSTPSNGALEGGAGDITLDDQSTYSGEDVVAGDEDAKVMAFTVEADDGSDVEVTSVKVEFFNENTASSSKLDDYVDSVSVWMNGEKVGEADAEDFSESSDFYSKSISLDGAIVRAGDKEDFVVAVNALNNLDSGDIDTDDWQVDLLNVRFKDADGVTTTTDADDAEEADGTPGNFEQNFDFDDLVTSGDLQLTLSTSSSSPDAGSVEVDDTSDTDVTMLEFKLKAEGSDMNIDSMQLTGTAVGVDATWADMVSEVSLEADGDEIDSVSSYLDNTDDTTGVLYFDDLDFDITDGDSVTFKVVAKIKDIAAGTGVGGTFDQGDSFTVSFTNAGLVDVAGADQTDVEDENGDTVAAGDRSGSAVGEAQAFYDSGVAVDMGSVTYETVTDSGNTTQVTYNIPLTVTSFGDTRYLGLSADKEADYTTIDTGAAFSYAFQDSADPNTDLEGGTSSSTFTCNADIEATTAYRLDDGEAVSCTLQVILTVPENLATSMRVHVEGVQTNTLAALTDGATELIQLLAPADEFQTGYKFITS